MKYIPYILTIIAVFFTFTQLTGIVQAQSPSPSVSPKPTITSNQISTNSADIDRIQRIKDLVASKVAELNLVEKRGVLGTVKEVENTQITLVDDQEEQRIIDIDELTKFTGSDDDEFGISDIDTGDTIAVVGLYNKDTKRILARVVSLPKSIPTIVDGLVIEKDDDEFTLVVVDDEGNKKTVGIETSTKTQLYDEKEMTKSGFSKIELNERVYAVGFDDSDDKTLLNASRVIHFANLQASPDMLKYKNAPEVVEDEEAPVSTGSGTKLTPITR